MTVATTNKPNRAPDAQEVDTNIRWWQRMLWCIGGFHADTLALAHCRAVRSKYSSMGALVLLTALLASCSGGYAIYTIFKELPITCIMGTLWGLMILTLDRFLVSTSRKLARPRDFNVNPDALPPYVSKNSWSLLVMRLPLAIIIGVVVAAPIEARLMRPLIEEFENKRTEDRQTTLEKDPQLRKLEGEFESLEDRAQQQFYEMTQAQAAADKEAAGTGNTRVKGTGPAWKAKATYSRDAQILLNNLNSQLKTKGEEIKARRTFLSSEVKRDFTERRDNRSIISDLVIMRDIAASPDAKGRAVWIVSSFLSFFFVLIECIPIISKAISPFDLYDATLQEIEHGRILDLLVEARRQYAEASYSE